ncbi:hypothetical protein EG329_002539 [Mollisiaceae sp. DMI_Dod_QoI]|nr:hypothetical protein EG329_002539 [Helotiales sp. DMI_Dod_QoI]
MFHCFPKLPIELRLKIWDYARRRKIFVHVDEESFRLRSSVPTPITFRVNHESRVATKKYYSKPYKTNSYSTKKVHPALHQQYFDPTVDVIYLTNLDDMSRWAQAKWLYTKVRNHPSLADLLREDLSNVQLLEIGKQYWRSEQFWDEDNYWEKAYIHNVNGFAKSCFSLFRGLKQLTINGGGLSLQHQAHAESCISTLTGCYEDIKDRGEIDGVVCSVPEIQVRMPCHQQDSGSDACDHCRELRAYQMTVYLEGIAQDAMDAEARARDEDYAGFEDSEDEDEENHGIEENDGHEENDGRGENVGRGENIGHGENHCYQENHGHEENIGHEENYGHEENVGHGEI